LQSIYENTLKKRKLSILGSTGSIGTQALEILEHHRAIFEIAALSAYSNWELLADQANRFRPDYLLLCNEDHRKSFEGRLKYKPDHLFYSSSYMSDLATIDDVILS